ncbi:MAG: hypothetical protein ACR2GY_01255 [Phycisphaerales bacterium]
MNLKDFVAQTLVQIAEGVTKAAKGAGESGAIVNPEISVHSMADPGMTSRKRPKNQLIEFDLAVTVDNSSSAKAGAGLRVFGIGATADGATASATQHVSRVRFSVPMALPVHDDGKN